MRYGIIRVFALLFILVGVAFAQQTQIKTEWVLVGGQPIHWDSPPRDAHLPVKTSRATILVFYPNGDFTSLGCLLIRQKDGSVLISHGDGFVVSAGHWKQDANAVTITSRVVYRTMPMTGDPNPEAEEQQVFALRVVDGRWDLRLSGKTYLPMPEMKDLNTLGAFTAARYDKR
jgi:hypothetical protein